MTALVLSVVILALSCATAAAQSQRCGEQGGGMLCPRNLCSSKSGYCGLGGDYCGQGCQTGGAALPGNFCCSHDGYCSIGAIHCGRDCKTGTCGRAWIAIDPRRLPEQPDDEVGAGNSEHE
uniref:Chitin-binding type-1 domain-containing protein n=1 Tax=Setaria viridis TaxID=4556 RepID=A0A4U6VWY1_SETVI|nr:hypothetical protein SEVIR_2G253800v2 [Setaria viridis]